MRGSTKIAAPPDAAVPRIAERVPFAFTVAELRGLIVASGLPVAADLAPDALAAAAEELSFAALLLLRDAPRRARGKTVVAWARPIAAAAERLASAIGPQPSADAVPAARALLLALGVTEGAEVPRDTLDWFRPRAHWPVVVESAAAAAAIVAGLAPDTAAPIRLRELHIAAARLADREAGVSARGRPPKVGMHGAMTVLARVVRDMTGAWPRSQHRPSDASHGRRWPPAILFAEAFVALVRQHAAARPGGLAGLPDAVRAELAGGTPQALDTRMRAIVRDLAKRPA